VGFVDRAKEALRHFPPGAEREALEALPDYVLSRDR
jgi:geranylgeranyl pyrophosphate synthase